MKDLILNNGFLQIMFRLIKTEMFSSLTNHDNNTFKIPLMLTYREAYYKCFLFFKRLNLWESWS